MLVSLEPLMRTAREKNCAVGAFNAPNLESAMAIIQAAEETKTPVILNHAQVHNTLIPFEVIAPILLDFARRASVPVCVHLDHGTTFEMCMQALRAGFTSIMYDASSAEYEQNVAQTAEMVRTAHAMGVTVEAELGHIFVSENGLGEAPAQTETAESFANLDDVYTSPELAKDFVERTGVDALAIAFGTAHGIYKVKPVLDLERISAIRRKIDVPFVMHGGSGVSEEEFRIAIRNGICKINYYTYMTLAGGRAVQQRLAGTGPEDNIYFHDLALTAVQAMKQNVVEAITVFNMR